MTGQKDLHTSTLCPAIFFPQHKPAAIRAPNTVGSQLEGCGAATGLKVFELPLMLDGSI